MLANILFEFDAADLIARIWFWVPSSRVRTPLGVCGTRGLAGSTCSRDNEHHIRELANSIRSKRYGVR
jgi:hypothetical protein